MTAAQNAFAYIDLDVEPVSVLSQDAWAYIDIRVTSAWDPVPHIWHVDKVDVRDGDELLVVGTGFGDLQATFDGKVWITSEGVDYELSVVSWSSVAATGSAYGSSRTIDPETGTVDPEHIEVVVTVPPEAVEIADLFVTTTTADVNPTWVYNGDASVVGGIISLVSGGGGAQAGTAVWKDRIDSWDQIDVVLDVYFSNDPPAGDGIGIALIDADIESTSFIADPAPYLGVAYEEGNYGIAAVLLRTDTVLPSCYMGDSGTFEDPEPQTVPFAWRPPDGLNNDLKVTFERVADDLATIQVRWNGVLVQEITEVYAPTTACYVVVGSAIDDSAAPDDDVELHSAYVVVG